MEQSTQEEVLETFDMTSSRVGDIECDGYPPDYNAATMASSRQAPPTPTSETCNHMRLEFPTTLGKRKRTSLVWENYNIIKDEAGEEYAVCKYCQNTKYKANGKTGTSNARRHLEACKEYKKMTPQSTVDGPMAPPFDQQLYREMLAEVILKHGYSFSYVEHEGVRKLHRYLNPRVKTVSRNTIKQICLAKHAELKDKLKCIIGGISSKVCLTCDIWTACTSRGYLTLTAHYVDDDWKLNSKVLSFCHCPPPHTGLEIYNLLYSLIKEWNLEKKIFTMTSDNATNMDNMIGHLRATLLENLAHDGEYFHIRCSAHILNLIVREGLKNIDACVVKVRDNVKYVDASEGRINQFYECAAKLNIKLSGKLWLDVATRWNSTYLMLRRALDYRRVLDCYASNENNYKFALLPSEWSKVEKICDLLQPFYDITCMFSGTEYPTANLYFINVWKIELRLKKAMDCDDVDIRTMAKEMKSKFDKYWSRYSVILGFAMILDPRFKFDFVKYALEQVHGKAFGSQLASNTYIQFCQLYKHYEFWCPNPLDSFNHGTSTHGVSSEGCDELEAFDASIGGCGANQKTELENYLECMRVDRTISLDVLQYWKDKSKNFPVLALMAKDILAISITTVASESTFSMGGRILNKWRSSLLSKNVDALVTTRNWLYGYEEIEEDDGTTVEPLKSVNTNNETEK